MKEYLNMDSLKSDIRDIYNGVIENWQDEPYFEFTSYADKDVVEECVEILAERLNEDMNKYLHMNNHRIEGNFNNVYNDYIYIEERGDYKDFADMIRRLDEGLTDEKTNEDRDWLTAWFWSTFGTFGIRYNFETELSEALYCAGQEESVAV